MDTELVRNELIRRLQIAYDFPLELAESYGIDPGADPGEPMDRLTLPPREFPPINEGPVIRGTLPFEVTSFCRGKSATVECRVRYILTLDERVEARGRPGRSISRLMFAYDVLEWRNFTDFDAAIGEHRRMEKPQWVPIRLDFLLHPQILRQIQDLVEEQARELEQARLSAR